MRNIDLVDAIDGEKNNEMITEQRVLSNPKIGFKIQAPIKKAIDTTKVEVRKIGLHVEAGAKLWKVKPNGGYINVDRKNKGQRAEFDTMKNQINKSKVEIKREMERQKYLSERREELDRKQRRVFRDKYAAKNDAIKFSASSKGRVFSDKYAAKIAKNDEVKLMYIKARNNKRSELEQTLRM